MSTTSNDGWIFCLIPIAIVVLLLVVNYINVSRQERREGVSGISRPLATINSAAINDALVQDYIAKGQKINAIKRYRELTGVGLKEAKDAVEFAEANPGVVAGKKQTPAYDAPDAGIRDLVRDGDIERAVEVYRVYAGVDEYTARNAVKTIENELGLGSKSDSSTTENAHILELLRQGNKIEAIKLYRALTGLGLKEAKDAVDEMERGMMF
jgi:ribosomal protein L7/L12